MFVNLASFKAVFNSSLTIYLNFTKELTSSRDIQPCTSDIYKSTSKHVLKTQNLNLNLNFNVHVLSHQ